MASSAGHAGGHGGLGRKYISFQLIVVLLALFAISITSACLAAYVLYRHEVSLKQLFAGHFERAMLAGELARDVEVLNAQVFERVLSGRKSQVDGYPALKHQMAVFRNSLDKLAAAEQGGGQEGLADIDRLQSEYFASLAALEERFRHDEARQQEQAEQGIALLQALTDLEGARSRYRSGASADLAAALQGFAATLAAAQATAAPGRLHQLEEMSERQALALRRVQDSASVPDDLAELTRRLEILGRRVFVSRNAAVALERATLADARETRVVAQRLAGAAFSHYQNLRRIAQEEMQRQERDVSHTLLAAAGFALFALLISGVAIAYVVRRVGWRLRDLSRAMNAHVAGERVPIPQQGEDEIGEMGRAFQVFVQARDAAEAEQLRQQQLLATAAITDSLSGLPNRRGFDEAYEREWKRCARQGQPLALAMADIDFFKAYNDHYGHLAGDACITAVAGILGRAFDRPGDYPARYGGEEFICILPDTDGAGAAHVAERFRLAMEAAGIVHEASQVAAVVTVSVGVASLVPGPHLDPYQLIRQADGALYRAKAGGRNRVVMAAADLAEA